MSAGEISVEPRAKDGRAQLYGATIGGAALGWRALAEGLCADDPGLRRGLTAAIAASPEVGLCWETPGVAAGDVEQPFAMATIPAPALERARPDPRPFAAHLDPSRGPAAVRTFTNLGGDAILIAPRPLPGVADSAYHHLAAFLRRAPPEQIDALWRAVGEALRQVWASRGEPVWLSTAGAGVAWLHVRLDRRPKYYRYAPFRRVGGR